MIIPTLKLHQSLVVPHLLLPRPLHPLELAQDVLLPRSALVHRQHPRPVQVLHALVLLVEVLLDRQADAVQYEAFVLDQPVVVANELLTLDVVDSVREQFVVGGRVDIVVPGEELLEELLSFPLQCSHPQLLLRLHLDRAGETLLADQLDHLGHGLLVDVCRLEHELVRKELKPHAVLNATHHHVVQQLQGVGLYLLPNRVEVLLHELQSPPCTRQAEEQTTNAEAAQVVQPGGDGQFAGQGELVPHLVEQRAVVHGLNCCLDLGSIADECELEVAPVLPLLQEGHLRDVPREAEVPLEDLPRNPFLDVGEPFQQPLVERTVAFALGDQLADVGGEVALDHLGGECCHLLEGGLQLHFLAAEDEFVNVPRVVLEGVAEGQLDVDDFAVLLPEQPPHLLAEAVLECLRHLQQLQLGQPRFELGEGAVEGFGGLVLCCVNGLQFLLEEGEECPGGGGESLSHKQTSLLMIIIAK